MDYYTEAFGEYAPHEDKDAAVKFALDAILVDARFEDLRKVLSPPSCGLEGVPGWILERRNENDRWPSGTLFRAYVDPEAFQLTFPEGFYDEARFRGFVAQAISAYVRQNPEQEGTLCDLGYWSS